MSPSEAPPRPLAVYLVPLGIVIAVGMIGVFFWAPLLAKAPLLLVGMSPIFRHLVLVSPHVDALSLYLVAVPRHFAPDPLCYFIGRDYGPLAVQWIEANSASSGRFIRTIERLFAKVGPFALLVSPELIVSTLAGAARVRFSVFVAMNLAGTVANVFVARWVGDALERQIEAITVFVRANLLPVTVVSVLVFALFNWLSTRRKAAREPEPVSSDPS